jgi:hypothetical protein
MHGGAPGSGGPRGSRDGNYKHGRYTAEAICLPQVAEAVYTRREGADQETASSLRINVLPPPSSSASATCVICCRATRNTTIRRARIRPLARTHQSDVSSNRLGASNADLFSEVCTSIMREFDLRQAQPVSRLLLAPLRTGFVTRPYPSYCVSSASKRRLLEPSPRPTPLRRPIQRCEEPSIQRAH